jgi:hypothetical protein
MPQQLQLIYSPWMKFCFKRPEANGQQVCFTGEDGKADSGASAVSAVLIEREGEAKKLLRVTLPLGVQLSAGHADYRRSRPADKRALPHMSRQRLYSRLRSDRGTDRQYAEGPMAGGAGL